MSHNHPRSPNIVLTRPSISGPTPSTPPPSTHPLPHSSSYDIHLESPIASPNLSSDAVDYGWSSPVLSTPRRSPSGRRYPSSQRAYSPNNTPPANPPAGETFHWGSPVLAPRHRAQGKKLDFTEEDGETVDPLHNLPSGTAGPEHARDLYAEDVDVDESAFKKSKRGPIKRLLLSTAQRVIPHPILTRLLTTPAFTPSPTQSTFPANVQHANALSNDERRKSTGTSSATIRALKQKERREGGFLRRKGRWPRKRLLLAILALTTLWYTWSSIQGILSKTPKVELTGKEPRSIDDDLSHPNADSPTPRSGVQTPKKEKDIYFGLPRSVLIPGAAKHPIERGMLQVNLSMPLDHHPIYQLIADARRQWDEKNKRQSKTLKEATEEYVRRNGFPPPKGFDKWWRFVKENKVRLPDEYDQINKDMYLFRAIKPEDLMKHVEEAASMDDTFTIKVKGRALRTRGTYDSEEIGGADARLQGQVELIMDYGIEKWTGDFQAVYGIHDTPQGFIGWDHRADLLELVEDGEYYQEDEELDTTVRGWEAACPYSAPARTFNRYSALMEKRNPLEGKSFIADHASQFDLCNAPQSLALHGMLSGRRPHVQEKLLPVFSLSRTSLNTDILGVPTEQWVESMPSIPWEERTRDRLMWRGSNTGAYYSTETPWRQSHRARLVKMADHEKPSKGDVAILPAPRADGAATLEEGAKKVAKVDVNRKMLDIAFAGAPLRQ
jgi:hypothetical protein